MNLKRGSIRTPFFILTYCNMRELKGVQIFILAAVVTFGSCSDPVPENIIEQFNTDSSKDSNEMELVDSLFNSIEFDFEEDDTIEKDSTETIEN